MVQALKHCLLNYGKALLARTADIQIKHLQGTESVQNTAGMILLQFYTAHAAQMWHFCNSVAVYRTDVTTYLLNFTYNQQLPSEI